MRYIIIAILLYFVFLFIRKFLRSLSGLQINKTQDSNDTSPKRKYDLDKIEDAEYREVKKD